MSQPPNFRPFDVHLAVSNVQRSTPTTTTLSIVFSTTSNGRWRASIHPPKIPADLKSEYAVKGLVYLVYLPSTTSSDIVASPSWATSPDCRTAPQHIKPYSLTSTSYSVVFPIPPAVVGLVAHVADGSTKSETTPARHLPTSGDRPSDAVIMDERRDGPRRLCDDDDDDVARRCFLRRLPRLRIDGEDDCILDDASDTAAVVVATQGGGGCGTLILLLLLLLLLLLIIIICSKSSTYAAMFAISVSSFSREV